MGACWFLWTDFVSQLLQKDYLVIQHVCFFFFFFQITSQNFSPIREKVPTNSTKRCHFCYIHIHWFRFSSVRYLLKSNLCDRIGIRFVELITNVKVPSNVSLSWVMTHVIESWYYGKLAAWYWWEYSNPHSREGVDQLKRCRHHECATFVAHTLISFLKCWGVLK